MHIRAAHRFLNDPGVPPEIRAELSQEKLLGPFLLGNVAADARVSGGLARTDTHFYDYGKKIIRPPGQNMLERHPELRIAVGEQRALVAGYIGHLAMDMVWSNDMLSPHFYARHWANEAIRFIMLHVLLCDLDARDYRQWPESFWESLIHAEPHHWLPFLSDSDLRTWRDLIADQFCVGCESQTLAILGKRVTIGEEGLRALLDDPAQMQTELWDHIPPALVAEVEIAMYDAMREQVLNYWGAEQS
jgi:hypothetical protein